ncbi:MAG: hypothetical protein ACFFBP_06885 [Promethearchaeota archaeon]
MNAETSDEKEDFELEKSGIVKKYFSRIFTTLKSDIRDRINELDIEEKKKKKIKKEFAFLPHDKQVEYLEEISNSSEPKIE